MANPNEHRPEPRKERKETENSLRLERALHTVNKSIRGSLGSRSLLLAPTAGPNAETDSAQQRAESKVLILDSATGNNAT